MSVKEKYKHVLGALLIFTGAVLFSGKAVMVKLAYRYDVDPVSLLVLRMLFSLPFYVVILLVSGTKSTPGKVTNRDWLLLVFLGIVGYYGASYFDFSGLKYITAGLERLILFIYPTIVVVISSVLFKKPVTAKQVFALVLTYGGILFVALHDISLEQGQTLKGSILIFLSALTYAMYLVGSEKLIPVLGTVRFTVYAMIISTIAVIFHNLLLEGVSVFHLKPEVYGIALIMAVFSTVIPSFFISEGIRLIGSGPASIVGSIGPVSTIVLAFIFLGESINLYQIIGTVLVLAGVLIVSSEK